MNKRLERMVSTKNFNKFPQGMQRDIIETLIAKNRKEAKRFAMIEFPRLKNNFTELMSCHYGFDIYNSEKAKMKFMEPDLLPFD